MRQPLWRVIFIVLSVAGILLAVNYIFHLNLSGVQVQLSYLYAILAIYGSLAFLFFPARQGAPRHSVPWYDVLLFLVLLGSVSYLSWRGFDVLQQTWSLAPPLHATVISILLWLTLIEAVRRTAGLTLTILVVLFSLYPVLAPYLPGLLKGPPVYSIKDIAAYHVLSTFSVMGIPMQVVGTLVIGYIIFGTTLQHTGASKFFLDIAFSLFGRARGGAAKVAVFSSGLFGTMSGSTISNVITTGSVTIPAMKMTGWPADYAGAIETGASAGGALMPPIMGAAAFIMALFLGVSYYQVALAALVPAFLYYLSLFVQVHGYAARVGLKGLDRSQVPSLWQTLKQGWFYLLAVILLLLFLFYFRWVAEAPFFASALLILLGMLRKETRFTLKTFADFIIDTGRLLAMLTTMLAAVGFIIGSFYLTGLGSTFSYEVARLAGGNLALLLVLGAISSFILGTGLTTAACYVFLAITVAPALITSGVNPMAAHLFILYWGILSDITPPVGFAAMAASTIAGVSAMRIMVVATRMALVRYVIPFFFVISPALILQKATPADIALHVGTAVLGVILIGGALERYVVGIGAIGRPLAGMFLVSGLLLLYPTWYVSLAGLGIAVIAVVSALLKRRLGGAQYPLANSGQ